MPEKILVGKCYFQWESEPQDALGQVFRCERCRKNAAALLVRWEYTIEAEGLTPVVWQTRQKNVCEPCYGLVTAGMEAMSRQGELALAFGGLKVVTRD